MQRRKILSMIDHNENGIPDSQEVAYKVSILVRSIVLIWSAGMLTATYMLETKFDATFIASVFSGTLATFGVDIRNKKDSNPGVTSPQVLSPPSKARRTTKQTVSDPPE